MLLLIPNNIFKVDTDLPIITDGYEVLHFDQEPILFTGFNRLHNRILGSLVDTDFENKNETFFHVLIDEETYLEFTHQKISYKEILKKTKTFFCIVNSFDLEVSSIYTKKYEEIPIENMPGDDSFCPDWSKDFSLNYAVKLAGGEANRHLANPDKISTVTKKLQEIVKAAIDALSIPKYAPKFCLSGGGFIKSSFKINFNIDLVSIKKDNPLFDFDLKEEYSIFLKEYLDYSINHLDDDLGNIVSKNVPIPYLSKVTEQGKEIIFKERGVKDDGFEGRLIKQIENSAISLNDISQTLGDSYSTIELLNISTDGNEKVLGIIDDNYKDNIETAISKMQAKSINIIKDSEPINYFIHVESISLKNRSGTAAIHTANPNDIISKPSFKITGKEPLDGSIFTESLHFNKYIEVKAIGTKEKTGKVLKLDIDYTPDEK